MNKFPYFEELHGDELINIVYSAFSFLQARLNLSPDKCHNIQKAMPAESTVFDLVASVGLGEEDVEAAFINGKVRPFSTQLQEGDRIALLPPGTPGPYRLILGIKNSKRRKD